MAISSSSSSNQDNQQKVQFPLDPAAYENLQEIGSGDKVVVYKAVCVPMNSAIVAIKSVDLNQSTADFETLSHPNILGDHCFFTTAERCLWVVMPFMTFGSLQSVIIAPSAFPGGLPEPSIAVVLKETLNAMSYLHGHERFHGDIKPAYILVDSDGSFKLADFGVSASFYDADFSTGAKDTSTRPYWVAPGGGGYKADIWAFGITALELALGGLPLSGLPLLSGNQILKIKNRFRLVDYENIIKDFRNQKYSAAFKDLVGSCIDREPKKRPAAEALLKHPFVHYCGGKDYLVGTVLPHLESVEERFKKRNRGLGVVNYGELKGEDFMWSGRGTTNILVVLPDALIVAVDSRVTAYSGEIGREEKKVKCISNNPPTRATWSNDKFDADQLLERIKTEAKESHNFDKIVESAKNYVQTTNCRRGFGSFLCSVEPTTGELSAYLVFHTTEVVEHETNCSKTEDGCYCHVARFHGCRKLKLGVYTLGSGGRFAIECLSEKYGFKFKADNPSASWKSYGKKARELGIDNLENARADVFSALLTAAFDDPLSGVPFRVSLIRKKGKISTVKYRFLRAYSKCDPVMLGSNYIGRSAYLVYPTLLEYNDNGKTAVNALNATSLLWWEGHPLTILKGDFTLQQIIFSEEKDLTRVLKGLKKVRKCPPFMKEIKNLQVKYYPCRTKKGKVVRAYVTKDLGQSGFLESLLEQKF